MMELMSTRSTVLLVLLTLVLVGACDDGGEPPPSSGPTTQSSPGPSAASPSPSVVVEGSCPNGSAAAAAEPLGGTVAGDVDGDEADDDVYLVLDEEGGPGCRTFLVVETEAGTLISPTSDEGVEHALQAPRVNVLVQVDGVGGSEILVDLEQGASTQFVGMFTVVDGALQRVRVQGPAPSGDLFPYGGSVGHIEGSDCGPEPGSVVVTTASPVGRRYEVRTTTYEMVDAVLQPLPQERPRVVEPNELGDIEAFQSSPFGSCGT